MAFTINGNVRGHIIRVKVPAINLFNSIIVDSPITNSRLNDIKATSDSKREPPDAIVSFIQWLHTVGRQLSITKTSIVFITFLQCGHDVMITFTLASIEAFFVFAFNSWLWLIVLLF